MQFSREVSDDSRFRRLGLVAMRDQSAMMARLRQLAEEPTEEERIAWQKQKEAGAVMTDHPLYRAGADPSYFVTRREVNGKGWCAIDGVQRIQSMVRGWVVRFRNRQKKAQAQFAFNSVHAIKIQRWWRRYLKKEERKRNAEALRAWSLETLVRHVKCVVRRLAYIADQIAMWDAAVKIQKIYRNIQFRKLLHLLKKKRLLDAVITVQRGYRAHKAWIQRVKWETTLVIAQAKKMREEYLFGTKTLEEANRLRLQTEELFNKHTSMFGRQLAASKKMKEHLARELEGVIEEGEQIEGQVTMSDVQHMKKAEFWAFDEQGKDPHDVVLRLQECRRLQWTTLDLSQGAPGMTKVMVRWPYGLQGKHGMFRLQCLYMSGNQIVGLPLDLYQLTNLTDLRVNDNRIKYVLKEISNLVDLQIFWIHGNQLLTLPHSMGELQKLQHLSVADNQLKDLPGSLGYCASLLELRLENNPDLTSPTPEICRCIKKPPEDKWDISVVKKYLRKVATAATDDNVRIEGMGLLMVPGALAKFQNLVAISLHNNRISEVPLAIMGLTKLERLKLSENRIEKISKAVSYLTNLQVLNLKKNRIKQNGMPVDSLVTLTKLLDLNLTRNLLITPPPEILRQPGPILLDYWMRVKQAPHTGILDLTAFKLKTFPVVDANPYIRKLTLSDNLLRQIPACVLRIVKLNELYLSNNLIDKIPERIDALSDLQVLHLASNSISEIPEELAGLGDLADLDLSYNELRFLPKHLGKISSLRKLSASHNKIVEVDDAIGYLQLWELNLGYNLLKSVPDMFENMPDMQRLNLEGNHMLQLPASIKFCTPMQELLLSRNWLTTLSRAVAHLGNISVLSLSRCRVKTLPPDLSKMVGLTTVDLEKNELDVFPVGICTAAAVRTVILKDNFLTELPPDMCDLPNLTALDVSHNKLTWISGELRFMTSLATLNLSNNSLRALPPVVPLPPPVFRLLQNLETLDVRNNDLRRLPLDLCECECLKNLLLDGNPWSEDHRLRRMLDAELRKGSGDLSIRIIEGSKLAKMDARAALSDPYVKLTFRGRTIKTAVIRGSLNPRWDQEFVWEIMQSRLLGLKGHEDRGSARDPKEDNENMIQIEVLDWDADGSDDSMGFVRLEVTESMIEQATVGLDNQGGLVMWCNLEGEDELGRKAEGKIKLGFVFRPLDGSLTSIWRYLQRLQRDGWNMMKTAGVDAMAKMHRIKKTPDGRLFDNDVDELRELEEVRRIDVWRKGVQDWLRHESLNREAWEDVDVYFAPPGEANRPWLMGKGRYDKQFEEMREFLRKRERDNPAFAKEKAPWESYTKEEADEALTTLLKDDFEWFPED